MSNEQEKKIIAALEKAMHDMHEKTVEYDIIGSYNKPYIFICTKTIAKKVKKYCNVDKNNIFLACGAYYKLCIQKPLKRKIRLEVV